jgi:hypothetical protein
MIYDQFKAYWMNEAANGRGADFDGWYGDQCVDLFNFYNRDVVGAPFLPTPDTGGAADLFNDFTASDFYDRIAYTSGMKFQQGDAVIWAANTAVTGSAGHVGIFDAGDSASFNSLDQNYPTGSLPHLQHHDYRGVLGVLRPKGGEDMNKDQATQLALYLRLAAGGTVDDANLNSEYDVAHILADPGYAAALAKQIYVANEGYRYKANNYDTVTASLNASVDALQKQLAAAQQAATSTTPTVQTPPSTETTSPSTPQLPTQDNTGAGWFAGLIAWLKSINGPKG